MRERFVERSLDADGLEWAARDDYIMHRWHELERAVRDYLTALDDPRHPNAYVDLGEGNNVMETRARLEAVLARL